MPAPAASTRPRSCGARWRGSPPAAAPPRRRGRRAGVFWDGPILGAVQSGADRIWPEHCGTMSYATTVPLDARLTASVGDLLGALGWKGLFQADFIDRGGAHILI